MKREYARITRMLDELLSKDSNKKGGVDMASWHSYTITLSNNNTEKQGIKFVTDHDSSIFEVDKETKKKILKALDLDNKFIRSFDLIKVNNRDITDGKLLINDINEITLIELKTTQKKLVNFPRGFFFSATENEFALAKRLGDQYQINL